MDPNNTHEVIFWDNLYKLRPWLNKVKISSKSYIFTQPHPQGCVM